MLIAQSRFLSLELHACAESGRGLPHSKTFGDSCVQLPREASWSAAVLCRFRLTGPALRFVLEGARPEKKIHDVSLVRL